MILYFLLTVLVAGIDQILKFWTVNNLKGNEDISLLNGVLKFTYVENRGAAFGILKGAKYLFILLVILLLIFYLYVMIKKKFDSKVLILGLSLIVGGGIGNATDRLFWGFVIDYIKLSFFPPVCNFADYCITAGTVLVLIYICFGKVKNQGKI